MSVAGNAHYDVAVVGAGPVGSFCALACAQRGAHVALLEANPGASRRLAGEWLHPPAVRLLRDAGIRLDSHPASAPGKGFVVFPEDGSEPIAIPYPNGSVGLACEHEAIVARLRDAIGRQSGVDFIPHARVRTVEDGQIVFSHAGASRTLGAERVVGADGRASIVRRSLGLSTGRATCSRMVGVLVAGGPLPMDGYGHVLLGGPGQMLLYRLGERVRIIVDVPPDLWHPPDRIAFLSDSYAGLLPDRLGAAFVEALRAGRFDAASNEVRPRITYGNRRRVLIGDAAGHYHPLTAAGMTLGFGDALAVAESLDFGDFARQRFEATRAPELLALGLYEVFADHRAEAVALRQAVYRGWRSGKGFRERTTRLLACEDSSTAHLALAFSATVTRAAVAETPRSFDPDAWRRTGDILRALAGRLGWFLRGVRRLPETHAAPRGDSANGQREARARDHLARALPASVPPAASVPRRRGSVPGPGRDAGRALERAVAHLLDLRGDDGGWEAELGWSPMLTAQYVLVHHLLDRPLGAGRRRRLLRAFERAALDGGTWGFHEHSSPHLFVTTLVYVAARMLGAERDDPWLAPARRFLETEGVVNIPSWGKFWLALLNLYDWRAVNPILPELWSLPRWLPLHPSNWYCHARLIYLALAAIYPRRFQAPVTPLIAALREELFPDGFAQVDFVAARGRLRDGDLYTRPTAGLRAAYALARLFERFHGRRRRARCVETLFRHIRWELQATTHASLSPLNGLPNILALWLRDPDDPDLHEALGQLDRWMWEDEERGARVALQRTASWDTGFALQALAAAPGSARVRDALGAGADFLRRQQVGPGIERFREAYRTDRLGGWCLGRAWQGWPVSDCTAEAALGLLAARRPEDAAAVRNAVRFILGAQNRDGGFGSYEAQRTGMPLEWLNSSEMFSDGMRERSYVECTASCLAALAACGQHFPLATGDAAPRAVARGDAWLRRAQSADGSWPGTWGVHYIYGTMFGVRGLVAAGAGPGDPALRLACRWLLDRQRADGGWGEHHSGCVTGRYVPHEESQVVQTAWALMALLDARDPDWPAISRGAAFLLDRQGTAGAWPRQDVAGVYARTGLLDYPLYRQYFPLHALGLYERRRQARLELAAPPAPAQAAD